MTDQANTLRDSLPERSDTQHSLTQSELRKYFEAAERFEATDLFLRSDHVPCMRIAGKLKSLETPPLDSEKFEAIIQESLRAAHWQKFLQVGSVDLGVDLSATARFRVNIFRTRGRCALAARRINPKILGYEELYLPKSLGNIAAKRQGLILVCGTTGSGKSTTIAAMLQQINLERACHILTIEDPIEFLFSDAKALINQREIGIDVPNFQTGLKSMMREGPDVVLIGEVRDKETFEVCLQAAETGQLVFVTLHAASTSQAFARIYEFFSEHDQGAVRHLLAFHMQAFICQKLVPTLRQDAQVVPAVEVLMQSPPTRKFILAGREHELDGVIKEQRASGMQSFNDSLIDLVDRNLVDPRVARELAPRPEEFAMRLRGIETE